MAKKQNINIEGNAGGNIVSGQSNTVNAKGDNRWVRWVVVGIVTTTLISALAYGYNHFALSFSGVQGQSQPKSETPADGDQPEQSRPEQ